MQIFIANCISSFALLSENLNYVKNGKKKIHLITIKLLVNN